MYKRLAPVSRLARIDQPHFDSKLLSVDLYSSGVYLSILGTRCIMPRNVVCGDIMLKWADWMIELA